MRLWELVKLALEGIRRTPLRTALTSLGVAIGIASLVGMVSFGVALQDQVVGSLLRSGVFDSITVTAAPRVTPRGRGGIAANRLREAIAVRQTGPRVPLDDDAVKKMAALAGVKEVYPEVRVPVEVKFEDATEFAAAMGVPMSASGQGLFQRIGVGRFFQNESDDACLIGLEFARRLSDGPSEALVGKTLTLAYAAAAAPGEAAQARSGEGVPAGPLGSTRLPRRVSHR